MTLFLLVAYFFRYNVCCLLVIMFVVDVIMFVVLFPSVRVWGIRFGGIMFVVWWLYCLLWMHNVYCLISIGVKCLLLKFLTRHNVCWYNVCYGCIMFVAGIPIGSVSFWSEMLVAKVYPTRYNVCWYVCCGSMFVAIIPVGSFSF